MKFLKLGYKRYTIFHIGMVTMIRWIAECLENFKENEHWTDDHYNWLNDFLKDPEAKVLFFWNDFDDMTLRVSTVHPPKFYD